MTYQFSALINSGTWEQVNGKLLLLALHNFTALVQRIFNGGEIQNIRSIPDNVLNA